MTVHLHEGDLPPSISLGGIVAVDTETMGLNPVRDRLCVVQLSAGDGVAHLVRFSPGAYDAPQLRRLLTDPVPGLQNYASLFDRLQNPNGAIKIYCEVAE